MIDASDYQDLLQWLYQNQDSIFNNATDGTWLELERWITDNPPPSVSDDITGPAEEEGEQPKKNNLNSLKRAVAKEHYKDTDADLFQALWGDAALWNPFYDASVYPPTQTQAPPAPPEPAEPEEPDPSPLPGASPGWHYRTSPDGSTMFIQKYSDGSWGDWQSDDPRAIEVPEPAEVPPPSPYTLVDMEADFGPAYAGWWGRVDARQDPPAWTYRAKDKDPGPPSPEVIGTDSVWQDSYQSPEEPPSDTADEMRVETLLAQVLDNQEDDPRVAEILEALSREEIESAIQEFVRETSG